MPPILPQEPLRSPLEPRENTETETVKLSHYVKLRYIDIEVLLYIRSGKMSITISLRLDEKIANQLEDIAKITDCSRSRLIREAIEQYVAEYTDYEIALERLRDDQDEIISSEQMKELLANED